MNIRNACLFVFALLFASPAAHGQSAALIEAAQREGRVLWYTTLLTEDASGPLVAAFKKKYRGIEAE